MSDDENYDGSDNENEEALDDEYSGMKNVAVILIDICASMFDNTRPIKKCLAAVYQQMDKMLMRGYRRNICVCLLRDEDIVLTQFNDNLIESSKKILDLLKQPTNDLKQTFERTSPPSLRYTFSECLKQMKNFAKTNPHIVLLTNDDNPHQGDQSENLSAIDVALSFRETNVKLLVLPLKSDFKYELFYGELLKAANDVPLDFIDSENRVYESVDDINDILECVIKNKVTVRRQYFRLFSKEGQELAFWTQVRHLVKPNNIYTNCTISRETKNEIKLEIEQEEQVHADTGKFVFKLPLLNEKVILEKKDFGQMSLQMPIGFRLLYFTSDKRTSIHYLHKRSLVLQNDEIDTENAKKQGLFNDLWHYCHNNKLLMICGYMGAGNRRVPQILEFTPEVFQSKPCFVGQIFVDCQLIGDYPPSDEFSFDDIESKSKSKIPENDRELGYLLEMIDKLMIKNFSPANFACYEYEAKAALLKAQLLDIDVPEVDDCFPTDEEVKETLGNTYDKLSDIFAIIEEPKQKRSRKK